MERLILLLSLVAFLINGCGTSIPESAVIKNEERIPTRVKPDADAPLPAAVFTHNNFHLAEAALVEAENKYGIQARRRLNQWVELIRTDNSRTDMEKLNKVNAFFNRLRFIDDNLHWGQEDYWATPVEFLASEGGDCEDFSLAKYFTLKAMGVNERRLYLTYVKNLNIDDYHMVMTYFEVPGINPLILDNLTDDIQPAVQRTDLLAVYSFNGTGVWMTQMRSPEDQLGKSDQLNRWQELLTRMPAGLQ